MPFECRRVTTEECVALRALVLRPGKPVDAARYQNEGNHVHFGVFSGGELISTVTAHPEAGFGFEKAWRIRGMATHPLWQSKGAGGVALQNMLEWGRSQGIPLFWCNARERAIPFYERHGFTVESELFDIAGIGPHKVMKRAL